MSLSLNSLPGQLNTEVRLPKKADRLYLDMLVRRADIQISQVDALDAKTASAFAAGTGMLPITLGLYSFTEESIGRVSTGVIFIVFCAIFTYGLLLISFMAGYRLKPWDNRPHLDQWAQIFSAEPMQDLDNIHAWLGNALRQSILGNRPSIESKVRYAKAAFVFLGVEVSFLTALVIAPLF